MTATGLPQGRTRDNDGHHARAGSCAMSAIMGKTRFPLAVCEMKYKLKEEG